MRYATCAYDEKTGRVCLMSATHTDTEIKFVQTDVIPPQEGALRNILKSVLANMPAENVDIRFHGRDRFVKTCDNGTEKYFIEITCDETFWYEICIHPKA